MIRRLGECVCLAAALEYLCNSAMVQECLSLLHTLFSHCPPSDKENGMIKRKE